jgi:hypothetical protein
MTPPALPRKFFVQTFKSGRLGVKCPICGNEEFLSPIPGDIDRTKQEGFRHVIMGIFGTDTLAAQPVRFQHCANCGYVLNFVIGNFPKEDRE